MILQSIEGIISYVILDIIYRVIYPLSFYLFYAIASKNARLFEFAFEGDTFLNLCLQNFSKEVSQPQHLIEKGDQFHHSKKHES